MLVWDSSLQAVSQRLQAQPNADWCAFPPDGNSILSCSTHEVVFWDARSGRERYRVAVHWEISAVAMSPDGCFLVIGDGAGRVHLMRVEGVAMDAPILTAWAGPPIAYGCVSCGTWTEVDRSALGATVACASCEKPARLNPFTVPCQWTRLRKIWDEDRRVLSREREVD